MKTLLVVSLIVLGLCVASGSEPGWSIEGKAITADNCSIGCPCILGEPPTHGRCKYTGIMIIEKGNYGKVDLKNVKFGLGGAFGRSAEMAEQEYDFVAFYVDDKASADQKDAMKKIFASPEFALFGTPSEILEVPIDVEGVKDFGVVGKTYGGTMGTIARIRVTPVQGANAGKPIVVENSAEPMFHWTALGKASECFFKGANTNWTFDGTSGESHRFMVKSGGSDSHGKGGHH